ncbi:MAG: ERF family protein [Opitutales bacterium]|nr:ERF family protein [Opitutales bacterium]
MSIYAKLQAIKGELCAGGLRQSGTNKFAGFSYFELSDFLPQIVAICKKYSVCTIYTWGPEVATLSAVDWEAKDGEDKSVVVSCPVPEDLAACGPKGASAMQSIGAAQTYLRRYLYLALFDLCECDAIDAAPQDKAPAPAKAKKADAPAPRYVPASERDELLGWLKDARAYPAAAAAIKDYLAAAKADRVTALGLEDLRRMVDSARAAMGADAAKGQQEKE